MTVIFKNILNKESLLNIYSRAVAFVKNNRILARVCSLCLIGMMAVGVSVVSVGITLGFKVNYSGSFIATVRNAQVFDAAKSINSVASGKESLNADDLKELREVFQLFCFDLLGLTNESASNAAREEAYGKVVDMLLEERAKAKANKDWATSDKIRNELTALGFEIKDGKGGSEWKLNK